MVFFGCFLGFYFQQSPNVIFNGICEFDGFIFLLMSFVSKPVGLPVLRDNSLEIVDLFLPIDLAIKVWLYPCLFSR